MVVSLMKRGIVVFGLALLAGWAGGTAFRKADHGKMADPLPDKVVERRDTVPQARWSGEDFKEAAKKLKPPIAGNPFAAELANWSDDEIKAALDESLPKPEWLLFGNPVVDVANSLFEEWAKRNFDAALAWFAGLESTNQQRLLSETLAKSWPGEKAGEAINFLRQHADLFPSYKKLELVALGIEAEAAKGPQALVELLRMLRTENLLYDMGESKDFKIPADFDFAALAATDEFSGVWGTAEGRSLMGKWIARDREAALAWIVGTKGVEAMSDFTAPPSGVSMKEHYAWLGDKLNTWPDEDRRRFLESTFMKRADFEFEDAIGTLSELATGVKDTAKADEVRALAVQGIYLGRLRQALPLLEAMEPARRFTALSEARQLWEPGFHRTSAPPDVKLLREKLEEWNASEQQIETIIGRFK